MPVLKFEVNKPVEVALKYASGKAVEGQYGPQVLFSTTTGDTFYVDPHVNDKIEALQLKAGERLSICKVKHNGTPLYWKVEKVNGSGETSKSAPPPVAPVSANGAVQSHSTPIVHTALSQAYAGAGIAAVDALKTIQQYAASKGWDLNFQEEDVRCVATSFMIRIMDGPKNGGQSWQH